MIVISLQCTFAPTAMTMTRKKRTISINTIRTFQQQPTTRRCTRSFLLTTMPKISTVTVAGLVVFASSAPSQAFAPISRLHLRFPSESAVDTSSTSQASRLQRFEDDDDDDYFRDTRIFERRSQSEELGNMPFLEEQDDDIFNDDDYFDEQKPDSLAAGNFWFNPKEGLDKFPDRGQRTTRSLPPSSAGIQLQRQQRQSKYKSGGLGPSLFGSR